MAYYHLAVMCIVKCILPATSGPSTPGSAAIKSGHKISIVGDEFMIDDQPLHILSGSLHYFRVPAEYWRDRLHKLKAAGLNSVSTYVEWSFHEPEERQYSFEGDRNVTAFVKMAAEEGLHVLLRPGPYICAERDLGGLPYWLLGKYNKIRLRSADTNFINETKIWMKKLFSQLTPLLFGNGGPIIMVQVENEYGSLSKNNTVYKTLLRDIFKQHVGDKALLYTSDGYSSHYIKHGAIPGTLTTINFPATNQSMMEMFSNLRQFMPHGPLMTAEFYSGWMTWWADNRQQVTSNTLISPLSEMLNQSISFNIYVFFGGTNFEFTSGASKNNTSMYQPDITSYDYDAPLSEAGDPTPKYFAIRDTIAKYKPEVKNITAPTASNKGAYGMISLTPRLVLLSPEGRASLGKTYPGVTGSQLPTFEKLRQRAGLVLYETTVGKAQGLLKIAKPRDRIYVYINGIIQGILHRMTKRMSVPLYTRNESVLSLLVENLGRINYGPFLHDYKGILSRVTFDGKTLNGSWSITGFPLETLDAVKLLSKSVEEVSPISKGPVLYEGFFVIPDQQQPLDTFLDPTGWGKGVIWVNGHNLGRYWPEVGPQVTLYLPGCWLRPAPDKNLVQVLELQLSSIIPSILSVPEAQLNGPLRNKQKNISFNSLLDFLLAFATIIMF